MANVQFPEVPAAQADQPGDPVDGNVYQVRLLGRCEEQRTQNVFWYEDLKPPGTATLLDIEDLYAQLSKPGSLIEKYLSVVANEFKLEWVLIDCPLQSKLATVEHGVSMAGTGGANFAPLVCAATISRYTLRKGRCGRGRVSMPAIPLAQVTQSKLVDIMFYFPFSQEMIKTQTDGTAAFTAGIFGWGTKTNPQPTFTALVYTRIRKELGTCKRRKFGRGI